jgi:predicted amidohydrolase YtcJ
VACTEAGLQAGFHVIGDRATAELLTALQKAAATLGTDAVRAAGHRVEHLEMVTADQAAVLAELGVTASVQPLFQDLWGRPGGMYDARLGPRGRGMNPFGTLHRAGVRLALGSDTPVTPFDPWAAVRAACLHPDESQRLPAGVAFAAHTAGGWEAAGREGGEVRVGAPAYLAVWDGVPAGDPLAVATREELPLPTCALTLVAGSVAYDAALLLQREDS